MNLLGCRDVTLPFGIPSSSPPLTLTLPHLSLAPLSLRHHVELRPKAASSWIRSQLADSLRSRHPYQVNLLLGGFDLPTSTPTLHWLDYLGTLATVPYAAHGYGAYFCLSLMDAHHRPDMTQEEGLDLLRMCIKELKIRFVMDLGSWKVRIVDREGTREVEL